MRKITKRAAIIGAATVLGISGAGVAFAAWTASGGGSASAQATTAQGLTVSPATTPASLYPGATADVEIDVTNPNPYPVSISSLAPGTITTGVSGCDGSNITFTVAAADLATPVAAHAASQHFVLHHAVHMVADAADECQGATFTIPVTVSGASAA